MWFLIVCFFFQAEDGIRDLVRSRGLGDVYKRQLLEGIFHEWMQVSHLLFAVLPVQVGIDGLTLNGTCLLYTSDAADDLLCVDLGGRRIIKKKNETTITGN